MQGVSGVGVMGLGGLAGWRLHRMARMRIRSVRPCMGCRLHVRGVVGRHAGLAGGAGRRIVARMRVVRHDDAALRCMAGMRVVLRGLGGDRCMARVWIRSVRPCMGCRLHVRGVVGRHAGLAGGAGRRIVARMRVVRHDG
ncbi:hypothetical protein, partial [Stenotrophomonas mori]|uniref:hypothetical protein n=1 Tax=Stenotrophomonas mori TaxID=2871096 RepID=UPI003CE5B7E3